MQDLKSLCLQLDTNTRLGVPVAQKQISTLLKTYFSRVPNSLLKTSGTLQTPNLPYSSLSGPITPLAGVQNCFSWCPRKSATQLASFELAPSKLEGVATSRLCFPKLHLALRFPPSPGLTVCHAEFLYFPPKNQGTLNIKSHPATSLWAVFFSPKNTVTPQILSFKTEQKGC